MKLAEKIIIGIPVGDMKDGDVAVILQWTDGCDCINNIVQRYKNVLIKLGSNSMYSFPTIFDNPQPNLNCRVQVLIPGTKLVL